MEATAGIPLSLATPNIWRGTNKSNGQLEFLHTNHVAVSYSSLVISSALQAELTAASAEGVPFGNGLFYDRNLKATLPGKVYAGIPTAVGAVPKLAGVLAYDAALASMQPVASRGVQAYNKGTIVKRGYLRYKSGKAAAAGATIEYDAIDDTTMKFFIENSTGDPVFAAPTAVTNGVPVLANCTYAGKIIHLYPEDESVLVELDF